MSALRAALPRTKYSSVPSGETEGSYSWSGVLNDASSALGGVQSTSRGRARDAGTRSSRPSVQTLPPITHQAKDAIASPATAPMSDQITKYRFPGFEVAVVASAMTVTLLFPLPLYSGERG